MAFGVRRLRHDSWQDVADLDEFQAFFDCYETAEEMKKDAARPRRYPMERRGSKDQRSLSLVPEA